MAVVVQNIVTFVKAILARIRHATESTIKEFPSSYVDSSTR